MAAHATIFGIPVYITEAAPEGELIFGRFPTEAELAEESIRIGRPYDICDWIEDHPTQYAVIKNIA